jgi:hypothetical protein
MYGSKRYDTYCYGSAIQYDSEVVSLSIQWVIYDPDGNDTDREQLWLLLSWSGMLDLSQGYLLVNGNKRNIQGILTPGQEIRLQDNFRFPNDGACVELRHNETLYDTYCYGDHAQLADDSPTQGELPSGQITAIFPNPVGADGDHEWVSGIVDPALWSDEFMERRSLRIGDRTTRTDPIIAGDIIRREGALSLPNRAGCVHLLFDATVVDTMCYLSTDDGRIVTTDQEDRHGLGSDALSLLNSLAVTQVGSGEDRQHCLRYRGTTLTCKDIPNGSSTTTPGERFYRDYISSLHAYLARNRSTVYYRTDVAQHVDLYRTVRTQLGQDRDMLTINGQEYETNTPFGTLWTDYHRDSYYDILVDDILRPVTIIPYEGETDVLAKIGGDPQY